MKAILALICALSLIPSLPGRTHPLTQTFQIDGPGIRCPGRYPISDNRSIPLYTVLYLSRGFCNFADQRKVQILRPQYGRTVAFKIDATDPETLLEFQVKPGDRLTVTTHRAVGDFPEGKPIGVKRR